MAYGVGMDWDICYVCIGNCPKPRIPDDGNRIDRSCFKWDDRKCSSPKIYGLMYTTPYEKVVKRVPYD